MEEEQSEREGGHTLFCRGANELGWNGELNDNVISVNMSGDQEIGTMLLGVAEKRWSM